ncbi:MAG: T9SS type A sorting domain-containing protein [Candidatus Zixiibacteriota bacterium]|nr:MAG: T9SS type A sorting domain-containing protein [candidate division Zixibacteria bacterium]
MRCHEAKERLTRLASARSAIDIDDDLREHLKTCRRCAGQYRAALDLRSSLERASGSDDTETVSLAALRTRTEAQVESASKEAERMNVMAKVVDQMKRPRYSLPAAAVAAVVLLAVILPLRFGNPVEYEVAFANVDPALAQDGTTLRMILSEIEMPDVDVTVGSCEEDCKLTISSIKSEEELGKLIAVFEKSANAIVVSANEVRYDHGVRLYFSVSEDQLEQMRKINIRISPRVQQMVNVVVPAVIEASRQVEGQFKGEAVVILEKSDGVYRVKSYEPGDNSIWIKIVMPGGGIAHRFRNDDGSADTFLQGCDIDPSFLHEGKETETENALAKGTDGLPGEFSLGQNYPNPFNPATDIQFTLPHATHVKLEVFNIMGQRVSTLVDRQMGAGTHSVTFDGGQLASGTYLYRLQAGDKVETKKMSLVK